MTSAVKCAPLGIAVLLAVFAAADASGSGGGCLRWTPWINADRNATDGGDFETIGFNLENGRAGRVTQELARRGIVCNNPVQVECREASSYRRKWHLTGDNPKIGLVLCTLNGFTCIDKYQKDGKCHDYEVRLLCFTDKCKQLTWSRWHDRDRPSGNCDAESRAYRYPGCDDGRTPLDIDCRTTADGTHAALTKDLKVRCDVNGGHACWNRDQPGYKQGSWAPLCLNYRARFLCGDPYSESVQTEDDFFTGDLFSS